MVYIQMSAPNLFHVADTLQEVLTYLPRRLVLLRLMRDTYHNPVKMPMDSIFASRKSYSITT